MLTEICQYLKNWFDRGHDKYIGDFEIKNGVLSLKNGTMNLLEGQYYRIIGSLLNDGVHQYTGLADESLVDESFSGSVWSMAIPSAVIQIAGEIEEWQKKYNNINSPAMSPYNSESFGGYSYSKSSGSASGGASGSGASWQSVFGGKLNIWRKILP